MSEVYARAAKFDGHCARCNQPIRRRTVCWLAPGTGATWIMSCYPSCEAVKLSQEAYTAKCRIGQPELPPKTDLTTAFKKYPLPWQKNGT